MHQSMRAVTPLKSFAGNASLEHFRVADERKGSIDLQFVCIAKCLLSKQPMSRKQ